MMSGILLYGFAAALLGGIDNPWGAAGGGFIVGILEKSCRRLCRRHRDQADRGAGAHRRRPGRAAVGPLRPRPRHPGLSMAIISETTRPVAASFAGLPLRTWQALGVALVLVVACVLPFTTSSYHLFQLTMVLVYMRSPCSASTS